MKPRICLYFFIPLFLFSIKSTAQKVQLDFNLVTGANGISLGKITSITQDKWGYMWFCDQSNRYLVRFDGYRMKTYRNDPKDGNSIAPSSFECFAADSSGNIWLETNEGVDKLDPLTGIATHYRFNKNSPCKGGITAAIIVDHLNSVWLGTSEGLYNLDQKTGGFTCYSHHDNDQTSLSCNIIRALYEDHEGTIWVGTGMPFDTLQEGGLNKFNRVTGKFTRYLHDANNPKTLINDKVKAIFEDSKGVFWVGTQGDGLHTMDRKTGTFERLTYDPAHPEKLSRPPVKKGNFWDHITFITEDKSGEIWIGSYLEGLTRYDPVTKEISHFKRDKSGSQGFKEITTWNAFISKDGELWITTETTNKETAKLYRTDPFHKSIHSISADKHVNDFVEDKDGYLWVGTSGGLLKFDQQKNLIKQYKHDPLDSFSLFDDGVGPLFQSGDNNTLLVGSLSSLQSLDKTSNQFSHFHNSDGLKDSAQMGFGKIFQDKKGIMWFGRWGMGLIRYDPKDNSTKHFLTRPNDSTSIVTNRLNSIIEDEAGTIWAAGAGGISSLNQHTGRFKNYLAGTLIWSLYEDSKNNLLAGTEKGLYRYDKTEDDFINFLDPQAEINSFAIGGIAEDNAHNLWLVSPSAIIKLDPLTKETFIYGSRFGILSNSLLSWTKTYKNKNGQLFIGHDNGFYVFSPEELSIKTDFKIIITNLFVNTFIVLPGKGSPIQKPIEEISDLDLKYNQNNITFHFAGIDFRQPEAIRYFTMLEGYDNIWREVIGEKVSNYFNLSPDKYIYRVKAFNSDGTKVEKIITIRINPPWWQTLWFRIVAILFAAALLYGFIQYRSRNLKQRNIVLEEKVMQRTNELHNSLAELKTAQDQLIQSEKMASLGELTSGIAHEIKNPLNFINNFSEINMELITEIEEEQIPVLNETDQAEIAENIKTLKKNSEKINHHSKRIDGIVKGMLQHSRLGNVNKEPVNINALCDESLKLAYHGFRAKEKTFNASFETQFDPDLPKIMVIPQDFGRVMLNLFNNAFYTVNEKKKQSQSESLPDAPEAESLYKPCVIVSTKKSGNKIIVTVSDNGSGIPPAIINKIFQPFFTTKPTGEGTGLGLSMSYDIITKSHGGELRAKSKEGIGTDFEIVLPI